MPSKRDNRETEIPACDRPAEELAKRTNRPIEEFEYDGEIPDLEELTLRVSDDHR